MQPTPGRPPVLASAVTAAAVLTAIVVCGLVIVSHPAWSLREDQVILAVQSIGGVAAAVIADTISILFGPVGAAPVALAVFAIGYLSTRSWQLMVRAGIVLVFSWGIAEVVKTVVRRPRPDPTALGLATTQPVSFSYPSGHTAFAAALVCAIVLMVAAGRARTAAIVAGAVLVLVTGWSRVYLGAHYPTDVIASMILVPVLAVAASRLTTRIPHLADPPRARTPDRTHDTV